MQPQPARSAPLPSVLRGDHRPDLLRDETLADIFETSAAEHGRSLAIVDGPLRISYAVLDAAADRVAHHLLAAGLGGPGRVVGLQLPRGAASLIAQLGITKTGAAWLAFDIATPAGRVASCLADCAASALIAGRVGGGGIPVLAVLDLLAEPPAGTRLLQRSGVSPDDTAYLIYTSGTTGSPKGIAVCHRAICHFLRSENVLLGIQAEDRVQHAFSLAFDMSFEEVWISYLVGASLRILPPAATGDPDAVAAGLEEHEVTVLHAVPSMAALLPRIPPGLRLVNLGGEACPQALADRMADGSRRVVNTYGPTEATVSASLAELRRGRPVSIGRPLPNYGLAVVDDALRPVPCGEPGELCVFGPGLAAGYVSRPELTTERFPSGPFPGLPGVPRLYRTGDRAALDAQGEVRFLGRLDSQVKVRGYRIELGEIEASLADIPGLQAAAAVVRDDAIVALLVAGEGAPDDEGIRASLAVRLPPYMLPSRLVRLGRLPRLPSGKIDRGQLLSMELPAIAAGDGGDKPAGPAETALAAALAAVLPGRSFRRQDDFFDDLGGHSLAAARLVSRLRALGHPRASVGDVYAGRRLGAIAAAITGSVRPGVAVVRRPADPGLRARRWACGAMQLILLPIPLCTHLATWLAPFFTYHYLTGDEGQSILLATVAATAVFLFSLPLALLAAVAAKRAVLPTVRPGRYPLWGWTYLRWWVSGRMADAAPVYLLNGTPLYRVYLRLLGARIGRDVSIGSVEVGEPGLLDIGDGASLGNAVRIANVRVAGGELVVGAVSIGPGVQIDSAVVIEEGVGIGAGAEVAAAAALPAGTVVPAGEAWHGIPGRASGGRPPPAGSILRPGAWRRCMEWLLYPAAGGLVAALFFLPIFPAFMLVDWIDGQWLDAYGNALHTVLATGVYLVLGLPAAAVLVLMTLVTAALVRWLVAPPLAPGSWPQHGATYYRTWVCAQIQENSLHVLHGLFATVYAPLWFRLLGASVGRGTEISTASGVTPELLHLGDDSFIADGAMLGDARVHHGLVTLLGTRIGTRSFIGNGALVPDGMAIPDDVLIGVQSVAPAQSRLAPGQTWMGNPPLLLPAREVVAGFSESLTFRPSHRRRLARAAVELLRIVLPLACVLAFGYVAVHVIMPMIELEEWFTATIALVAAGVGFGVACLVLVLAAKWLLIGRYRPGAAPMWTSFVWRSEAVTSIYESLAVPNLLEYLRGTPLLPACLRLFGARIGRGTWLDTTDLTEFDCVEIGDEAELNAECGPQTHLFEDRIMKIGLVRIGARATIGVRSTVLYDSELGDGVRIGPSTLVAKGERLPADTAWSGAPAAPDA